MNGAVSVCSCTNNRFEIIESHQTEIIGIEVVLHNSAERVKCRDCHDETIMIPNMAGLIAAIAMLRVLNPIKLKGSEIRFIRKSLGLSAKKFASILEVSAESFSRWENDKSPISSVYEKLLRIFAAKNLQEKAPAIDMDIDTLVHMHIKPVCSSNRKMIFHLERLRMDEETRQANKNKARLADAYTSSLAA